MTSIRPSSVRQRILREHGSLRGMLNELRALVLALQGGDESQLGRVRSLAESLREELLAHVDLEDAMLAPTLREADAWGPARADDLLRHHKEQRVELSSLHPIHTSTLDASALAEKLKLFIHGLELDMQHEESDLLSCLRDDVLGVDVEDG